jgi:hypothetical protein
MPPASEQLHQDVAFHQQQQQLAGIDTAGAAAAAEAAADSDSAFDDAVRYIAAVTGLQPQAAHPAHEMAAPLVSSVQHQVISDSSSSLAAQ